MERTLYVNGTEAAVRNLILRIPQGFRRNNDIVSKLMTRIGLLILTHISRAFIEKSDGGTDEAGDRWQPLSPKTIAYSRGKKLRTRTERKRDIHPSQALSEKQKQRWRYLYRQGLDIFKGNKGNAARRAWAILKQEGATTLLNKYGTRNVKILQDTGALLKSISPGSKSKDQVFRIEDQAIIIGTTRKGAAAHHHGVPGKLPQRRLWPEPGKWPNSWWKEITEEVKQTVIQITEELVRGK